MVTPTVSRQSSTSSRSSVVTPILDGIAFGPWEPSNIAGL